MAPAAHCTAYWGKGVDVRRGSALVKVLAPAVAAALLGSAVIIGGCGDDDDAGVPGPTGSITVSVDGGADVTMGGAERPQ